VAVLTGAAGAGVCGLQAVRVMAVSIALTMAKDFIEKFCR
jgi:hypothetical protein